MTARDGHVRVLPLHVANKIAAGEVVERPASVVKELVENAIDAGAANIRVTVSQGGRKLVAVQDDGCGMTRDDAVLSLERQATSKILDVGDIEEIDTLGFRGEAIPSIASVSRFSITTRRHDSDEGTLVVVNAGTLAEVSPAGCPPGTLVEVRDLFCNVPARRKFLRSFPTEESHVKNVFTVHALAHPSIGFSLVVDGRELYRLAPASTLSDRLLDVFGPDFAENLIPLSFPPLPADAPQGHPPANQSVRITGYIEKPNLSMPTRRDQYVFVNGRPATAPSIAYAVREAYPRHQGDVKPSLFLFIELPPNQVDVNVHPTKREVRFRDNAMVKRAITDAIESALGTRDLRPSPTNPPTPQPTNPPTPLPTNLSTFQPSNFSTPQPTNPPTHQPTNPPLPPQPAPVSVDLPLAADDGGAKPWKWFRFLANTESGYLIVETDAGLVTINPHAARERIAFERLIDASRGGSAALSQQLLIPDAVRLAPLDAARVSAAICDIRAMGFRIEEFGRDTFKVDAVPQLLGGLSPADMLATIARDLSEGGARRGERWREELIAKSIARSFAGMSVALDEKGATRLVEELAACRMPYVCPRGKPIMIFTSTRELDRKFAKNR
jgi:DNA mismatch repair protein MutL